MNEDEKVLVCGYGFLRTTDNNQLKVLSLSKNGFYEQNWDDKLDTENVFIFWTHEIDQLTYFIKGFCLATQPNEIYSNISLYEPCPFRIIQNIVTKNLRLEITNELSEK